MKTTVEYTPREAAGKVTLFEGFDLWNEVDFELDGYAGYRVSGLVRLHGTRYELDELHVVRRADGAEVSGAGLREVKPPALIRNVLRTQADPMRPTSVAWGLFSPEEVEAAKAEGPTPDTIRMVAKTYLAAHAVQDPPARTVQDLFGVSPRTAGNWIAKAKAAGLIRAEVG